MQLAAEEQLRRGNEFLDLHVGDTAFVMPNPWDAGSARLLLQLGFPALATTSAGLSFMMGKPDGENRVTRAEALDNARSIVAATDLPVSADLESCYAGSAGGIAGTIRLGAEAGLVGCSIEDAAGDPADPPGAEAIRAVCTAVDRPVNVLAGAAHTLSVDELMAHVPGPDFPTGGIIMGRNTIRQAYHTGRGSIVMRAVSP